MAQDRHKSMFVLFSDMLASLGGRFDRFTSDQERKQHAPKLNLEQRDVDPGDYHFKPTGWRNRVHHRSKRVRSRMKRVEKRMELKILTAGVSLPTARRIWRQLQHLKAIYKTA
jgi:hypothetical protein